MASQFDKSAVIGAQAAKQAMAQIEPVMREAFILAVEDTAKSVTADAQRRLTPGHGYRTGTLQHQIGWSVSQITGIGRVGVMKGRFRITLPNGRTVTHVPSKIAHLVEFGHGGPHPAPPYPFMIPAAEANRAYFADRIKARAKEGERQLEHIGDRYL